jgi:hypothetical protein
MRKLLFSTLGVLGVVGGSLAIKTFGNFILFCTAEIPTSDPNGFCDVTVTGLTDSVIPGHTLGTVNCSKIKHGDNNCDERRVYTISNA